MAQIDLAQVRKTFIKNVRQTGRFGTLRTLLSRQKQMVHAVEDISFSIEAGEMVGYIGPNGAGKSTTMKMLTGILVPSAGRLVVDGRVPHLERVAHVRQIGVVFGQRTQLWWDLPTIESFELLRYIYHIPLEQWRKNLREFGELLELEPFLNTPVRQLSLGQRMRADLVAALLHEPRILFLDEPTIGLDVVAKERIRHFLARINHERGVTVILTTHDLADIERLCQRVVLIDHGRVVYDGMLEALRQQFGRRRTLVIDLGHDVAQIDVPQATSIHRDGLRLSIEFDREATTAAALIADVASRYPIRDLTVQEPEIEGIVRHIYESKDGIGDFLNNTNGRS